MGELHYTNITIKSAVYRLDHIIDKLSGTVWIISAL
jgi:hypothetical protein